MIQRPPDEEGAPQKAPLPTRDAVSNSQINILLAVLDSLQPYILLSPREIESGIPKDLDGGVPLAALSTFCKVCNRIDKIVDCEDRWSLATHDQLYEALLKTAEKQRETLETQQNFVRDSGRPSRTHKPEFTRLGDVFIAYWGDLNDPPSVIIGRGQTPEDAINDFDRAFARRMAEQLRIVQEQPPQPVVVPAPIQKNKKKK